MKENKEFTRIADWCGQMAYKVYFKIELYGATQNSNTPPETNPIPHWDANQTHTAIEI